jgi:predicted AlkP superfamily pyrophosphatase or phosphodiesterase
MANLPSRRPAPRATLLGVGALLCVVGCARQDAAPLPKVLILGIDGVRPDVLAEVPTPHLDSLIAAGAFSGQAQTALPTISGPDWSSMLTGVWPAKHGVLNNDFSTNRYDRYPDLFTRLESLRPDLRTFVVADWLPLVTATDGGPLIGLADSVVVLDGYDLGWAEADSVSASIAAAHLRQADVDAAFVYLGNPDETSHQARSIGEEYRAAIALADRHVGQIMAALAGPLAEPPQAVDVAVTALAHLGIPIDPAWELDGKVAGIASPGMPGGNGPRAQ